jgi:hypothetical protein
MWMIVKQIFGTCMAENTLLLLQLDCTISAFCLALFKPSVLNIGSEWQFLNPSAVFERPETMVKNRAVFFMLPRAADH